MTAGRYPVGRSSFTDYSSTTPLGKMQHVSTLIVAQQTASLCYEFDTQFLGALARGDRLTVNEAIREDDRAIQLYEDYRRDPAHHPLAAYASRRPRVITTTHRADIGNALDLGITQRNGKNRALTPAEAAWVDRMGPRRGIRPTGNGFARPESWHKNGGFAYSVAPIVGVNLPGEEFYTDRVHPEPEDMEADMSNTTTGAIEWDGNKPILRTPLGSWYIVNSTVNGERVETPQTLALLRRQIRADQDKDKALSINGQERNIIDYAYAQARKAFVLEVAAAVKGGKA